MSDETTLTLGGRYSFFKNHAEPLAPLFYCYQIGPRRGDLILTGEARRGRAVSAKEAEFQSPYKLYVHCTLSVGPQLPHFVSVHKRESVQHTHRSGSWRSRCHRPPSRKGWSGPSYTRLGLGMRTHTRHCRDQGESPQSGSSLPLRSC
jgi:hypothetical protein